MDSSETSANISFILKELDDIHFQAGPLFQRLQRYKCLNSCQNNELDAIYNLIESHSPGLRSKAALRYEKLLTSDAESINKDSPLYLTKENMGFTCSTAAKEENVRRVLRQIEDLPKRYLLCIISEWTLVQLTPQYNAADNINEDNKIYYTNPIHISVFNCGKNQVDPFMVTVDSPKDPVNGKQVELAQEMMSIITGNKEALMFNKQKTFKNHKEKSSYFNRRQSIEDRLRAIIRDLENMWLKEWRCLLSGKYYDDKLEEQIKYEIKNFLKSEASDLDISEKIRTILGYVVKGTPYLTSVEIKRAVYYCFPKMEDKNFRRTLAQFIKNLGDKLIVRGVNDKKHPLILILDDSLDCFPWEMMDILQNEPISRVPSFHFIYSLFKEHEKTIVDGHKIVSEFERGAYIVNPDMDLKNMEVRMMNFFNYWTPKWTGTSGSQPGGETFFELLTSSEIFSPCVVGMLWEVTDLDTDILTTEFMSQWIPSTAPTHWKYVDKTKWKKAEDKIKFTKSKTVVDDDSNYCEPELLRALSLSKKSVSFYGTKSACVARGLPVKIQISN
ncbi:hypothetical protein NQ318_001971 [Aromia moschata]|uniref:separase n=1 Tax=Aromia moschata TaxID=1265417 RepID=A0AAV8Z274_9CUCU|nr:hypothetical protein NQ318_001971 [Aromia moschata]